MLTNNIKRIFLSFAQTYFRDVHPTIKWDVDVRKTQIFIGDKMVAAPTVYEQMPSILLSRGSATFAQTSIDQMQTMTKWWDNTGKLRTDLVRGSVTFHCMSQNGIEAEEIANVLFHQIVGFKDQFREHGVHQIMGVSMGEEQVVRGDVVPRLALVQVNVVFTVQVSLLTIEDLYSAIVYTDSDYLGQITSDPWSRDRYMFGYTISGSTLTFNYAPVIGTNISMNWTGAITLNSYTNFTPSGIIDGSNNVFTLPEPIYTPYYMYSGLIVYVSGIYEQ